MRALAHAWLLVVARAVQMDRLHSAGAALRTAPSSDPWGRDWKSLAAGLTFVTIDTRSNVSTMPMLGLPGISMENAGVGKPKIKKYKWTCYLEWLQRQDPETLVAMVDTDVVYGGCDLGLFVREFMDLTKAANSKVVGGAEFGIFPRNDSDTLRRYDALDEQLLRVHAAFGSRPDGYTRLAACPPNGAPCSDPPRYKFVNSGFLMGQAGDLRRAFSKMLLMEDNEDQSNFRDLYLEGTNGVTLDFTGRLCLTMYGFNLESKSLQTEVLDRNLTDLTAVTGLYEHPVCFTHWNGKSRGYANYFFPRLKKSPPFDRV